MKGRVCEVLKELVEGWVVDVEIMSQQVIYYSLLFVLLSVFIVRKFVFVLLLSTYFEIYAYIYFSVCGFKRCGCPSS